MMNMTGETCSRNTQTCTTAPSRSDPLDPVGPALEGASRISGS